MNKYFIFFIFLVLEINSAVCVIHSQDRKSSYPSFNWNTVPVAFHFGNSSRLMTPSEAQFVAEHSNFICLEKGHASKQFSTTEEGIEKEAQQLKTFNAGMKVIFYWNTFLDYNSYAAYNEYQKHPEWWLKKIDGQLDFKNRGLKRYDLSNVEFRDWWTNVARKAVVEGACDGVFMDAFPQVSNKNNEKIWGKEKYSNIQKGLKDIIKETRTKIGEDNLIVYNGIRSNSAMQLGNDFPEHTDAIMIEHFGYFQSGSKEFMLRDILEMQKAGKSGKIVVFKAWPGFAWIDKEIMKKSLKEKVKIAKENITFPLAAFLAGAQENSYFIYNWGYRMEMGCLEWYPEFNRPLGKPLGDAIINGWELTREFEHISVSINLETREALITEK